MAKGMKSAARGFVLVDGTPVFKGVGRDSSKGKDGEPVFKGLGKDSSKGKDGKPVLKGLGKGTGKDKNGNPQVCFAWRNIGICAKKEAGTCIYAHPNSAENTGKPSSEKGKGKGKDGKRTRSTSSRGGAGKGGDRTRSPSPRGKTVTDPKLLCQNFLKGKCSKGKACTYHHNGACTFHKK